MIPPETVYAAPPYSWTRVRTLVPAGVTSAIRPSGLCATTTLRPRFVRPAFEPIEVVAVEHDPAQLHAAGGEAAGGQRRGPGSVWRSRRHQESGKARGYRGVAAFASPSTSFCQAGEQRLEPPGNVGAQADHVAPLAQIRAQVEEERSAAVEEQLPVAGAHGPLRGGADHPPEQRPLDLGRAPFEHRQQVDAFEVRLGGHRRSCRGKNRGRQVHRDPDLARDTAGRNVSRPAEDRRHPDPAFPDRPLVLEERRVPRQPFAAVVVGEDHDRVLPQAKVVEGPQDPADAPIGVFEHRHVVGARAGRIVERTEVPGIVPGLGRLARHLVGPMRGVVRHVDEERPLRVLLDESHRPLGDQVGHVAGGLHRPVVFEQIGLSFAGGVLVVVGETALEAEEVIEAVGAGTELRLVAQVPLAHQRGGVAVVLQQLRQRPSGDRQSPPPVPRSFVAQRLLDGERAADSGRR